MAEDRRRDLRYLPEGIGLKIALCHDWLNGMRGGEKCLEAIADLYPEAPIYTLFHEPGRIGPTLAKKVIRTSPLQRFPGVFKYYRYYLPFFPWAVRGLKMASYDGLISTSHCAIKGVSKSNKAWHVCYCFTPMRYAWDKFDNYFGEKKGIKKSILKAIIDPIRRWDDRNSEGVDAFVAISDHVAGRIKRFYGREAAVIYPPVSTDYFTPSQDRRDDFYLIVSALVPYKQIDLAIQAFNQLGRKLIIIGEGPERARLERQAGVSVKFLGWRSDEEIRSYYRRCRALIFPGEEDFGIVPVEVQACGGFVIAYRKGGVVETVIEGKTGCFFDQPTIESLVNAVIQFEHQAWNPAESRKNAEKYSLARFKSEFKRFMDRFVKERAS